VRALAVVHQPDAPAGVFGDAVVATGWELEHWIPSQEHSPQLDGIGAVLVFGGGMHVDQEERHPWLRGEKAFLRELLQRRTPILGVCLGAELLAEAAGAPARRATQPEIGWHEIELTPEASGDPLLGPLPQRFEGFGWHSYEIDLPPGAAPLARSTACLQAYRLEDASWGVQFHAEVTGETVERWLADYRKDEDAVRAGIDPEEIRMQTGPRIAAWNELGRGLCERFLAEAER
jgi:GMP synthase-like glutamine amidotransferase